MSVADAELRAVWQLMPLSWQLLCVPCEVELPLQVHGPPQLLQLDPQYGLPPPAPPPLPLRREDEDEVGQVPPPWQHLEWLEHPERPHHFLREPAAAERP